MKKLLLEFSDLPSYPVYRRIARYAVTALLLIKQILSAVGRFDSFFLKR